ncbi:MAG TPA: hypothetical protein VK142_02415 [Bacillota bacterium]|nr:hypothetical protein [Bacillota bacterium]
MKEYIGSCHHCGKDIYCENGFFNGVLLPGHIYRCFECDDEISKEQKDNGMS